MKGKRERRKRRKSKREEEKKGQPNIELRRCVEYYA